MTNRKVTEVDPAFLKFKFEMAIVSLNETNPIIAQELLSWPKYLEAALDEQTHINKQLSKLVNGESEFRFGSDVKNFSTGLSKEAYEFALSKLTKDERDK